MEKEFDKKPGDKGYMSIKREGFELTMFFLTELSRAFARRISEEKKFRVLIEYNPEEKKTKIIFSDSINEDKTD